MFKTLEEAKRERNSMMGFDPENQKECLEAVKYNGRALRYVKEQTPEICATAVKADPWALQCVKDLSMLVG